MVKPKKNPFEAYTSVERGKDKHSLEWEESALDSKSYVEGFHDTERQPIPVAFFWLLLLAVFLVLGVKLFHLQIVHGKEYRALAEGNRIRDEVVLAPRGLIKDRYGEMLAQNTASFNLVAVPFDLPKAGLSDEVNQLCSLFNLNIKDVQAAISRAGSSSFEPVIIKQDLSSQENILFETKADQFTGFAIQVNPIRQYPEAEAFSHVLGYTGIISDAEMQQHTSDSYYVNDYIGKSGIELSYEPYLRGQNGEEQIEVDATGKLVRVLGQDDPVPGDTLELSIDKGLQDKLYEDLKGKRAAAVALNPKTGEVLALVSTPGYDSNLFAHGISNTDYQNLLNNKDLPLFNRAIAGVYPPGSTSKLMTATAGLQEGVVNENTIINDTGAISVPNQYGGTSYQFRGWKAGGLGPMTIRSAIAMSSDIYFYEVAGGPPNGSWQGLGAERLATYFRKFGLGKITDIDLPGEKPGLVPDPAWKMNYFRNNPLQGKWYLGDTYHMGIGQGDLLVTPLQVAEWTSVIANGGTSFVPQVASRIIDQDGKVVWQRQSKVLASNIASNDVIKVVQEGMRQTVLAGTARSLQSLPVSSAGKTGTSQFDGSDPTRTHAWFTSYAPYEDPQIVVTVLVEAGGEGNEAALPVAKDALQWWAENRYNKK